MAPLKRKFTRNLETLVHLITAYGFKIRVVGGAVRDVLLGRTPRDIDLITDALPDAVMYILGKHKIPYRTKGIPHGTVKVRFGEDEDYEITSLGYQVEDDCCPQNVVIHSGQSWRGDAERRDFSIDQMSVDLDGLLYDYLDGVKDLRNQQVKFIGDPKERIQKDPVLILRFFRLLSLFREPKFDKATLLPLIKQKMRLVKRVKPERIQRELENIKAGPSGEKVRRLMKNLGFDEVLEIDENLLCHLLEYGPATLVPALKVVTADGTEHVIPGQRGQTHGDIYNDYESQIPEDALQVDSGFFDTQEKRYLTRVEAQRLLLDDPKSNTQMTSLNLKDIQNPV